VQCRTGDMQGLSLAAAMWVFFGYGSSSEERAASWCPGSLVDADTSHA
jgi:hypothetical protein